MRSQRFKGGSTPAVTRFLAAHQDCEGSFDAQRDEDAGGALRIRCDGCGETVAYRVSSAEEAAGMDLDTPLVPRDGAPGDGALRRRRPAAASGAEDDVAESRRSLRPRGRVLAAAAVVGAAAVAAFLMVASGEDGDDGEGQGSAGAASAPAEPAPTPAQAAAAPTGSAQDALGQRRFYQRFSIRVPSGWSASNSGDDASFAASSGDCGLTVFFGSSELSSIDFARSSELFLAQRQPGSVVGPIYPAKYNGRAVARIRNDYSGGEEIGTFFTLRGTSYVLLLRVEDDASRQLQRTSQAALASFKPR
jgi:hypothetical protein